MWQLYVADSQSARYKSSPVRWLMINVLTLKACYLSCRFGPPIKCGLVLTSNYLELTSHILFS
jgi:hypothetical protein